MHMSALRCSSPLTINILDREYYRIEAIKNNTRCNSLVYFRLNLFKEMTVFMTVLSVSYNSLI